MKAQTSCHSLWIVRDVRQCCRKSTRTPTGFTSCQYPVKRNSNLMPKQALSDALDKSDLKDSDTLINCIGLMEISH